MDLPKYSSVENILEGVRAMRPRGDSIQINCRKDINNGIGHTFW
jgi:hypothetical protein